MHCHKLLSEDTAINSERIHYSNANNTVQEKKYKVNIIMYISHFLLKINNSTFTHKT